jgi:hypothetical protein
MSVARSRRRRSQVGLSVGRSRDAVSDLRRDNQRVGQRERALRQPISEGLAFEVLHDEERGAALLPDVIQRADVGMIELGDRSGFAVEALAELQVASETLGKNLDGDDAIEASVLGLVDFAHPARAQRGEDFVRAEAKPG